MADEFDFEFDPDEIEETIRELAMMIEAQESEPQVLNLPRMLQMVQAYKQLQSIACEDWKITTVVHKPVTSMGVICIEAEDLIFDRMTEINKVLISADNVEIYPLTNGNIRMTIAFHGITKPVE